MSPGLIKSGGGFLKAMSMNWLIENGEGLTREEMIIELMKRYQFDRSNAATGADIYLIGKEEERRGGVDVLKDLQYEAKNTLVDDFILLASENKWENLEVIFISDENGKFEIWLKNLIERKLNTWGGVWKNYKVILKEMICEGNKKRGEGLIRVKLRKKVVK